MAEPFTLHVFGNKWVGETTNYSYLLWPANLFLPTLMVCTCLLNAFGLSKTVLNFNLLWMLLTLGLGTPLIVAFGAKGFGYANIIVNIATIIVPITLRKYIDCQTFKELFLGWLPAIALAGIPLTFRYFSADSKLYLVLNIICYYAAAAALTYFLCRKDIQKTLKKF
jgi:O-antigen/teichoic acid export membrane protein